MKGLALAAVLAFSWANRAGCCWLAAHTPRTVRPGGPAAAAPPAAPAGPPAVRALVFGDFGDPTCQQAAVARGLLASHARAPADLAFHIGDNLYECGPDPRLPGAAACAFDADLNAVRPGFAAPADPRFRERFERPLEGLVKDGAPVPVFLALGNHDVYGSGSCQEASLPPDEVRRLKACLEVAHRSPQWSMPARHFVVDRGPARFIVLDSNAVGQDYVGFTLAQEAAFLAEASAGCADRTCFVVAHHPPASAGDHAGALAEAGAWTPRMRELLAAARGPIAGWLAGHDHDLQHLRLPGGLDVFVSGNGARWRDEKFERIGPPSAGLHFASTAWGHAVLEVWKERWALRFEDFEGKALHCCAAAGRGPCQPVACPPAGSP